MVDNYISTPDTNSECSDLDDYTFDVSGEIFDNDSSDNSDDAFMFNQDEEYIFVNHLLNLLSGGTSLPSYAYYDSNNHLRNFWNSLDEDDFYQIYEYLADCDCINHDDTLNDEQIQNQVLSFVRSYFIASNINDDYENPHLL
jgi:hypothetical protein